MAAVRGTGDAQQVVVVLRRRTHVGQRGRPGCTKGERSSVEAVLQEVLFSCMVWSHGVRGNCNCSSRLSDSLQLRTWILILVYAS